MSVGIWQISEGGPSRMNPSRVDLEQHLEEWIAADTSLLQAGLVIVGRQLYTAGGPLDLLALDMQGRWVVIEIKRGEVRRETVAQAIDYASCIVSMPADELREKTNLYLRDHPVGELRTLDGVLEQRGFRLDDEETRDVSLIVVGTSQDEGLDRMVNFLAERGNLSISVVSFEVFSLPSGERVLIRELTESDVAVTIDAPRRATRPMPTLEEFYHLAEAVGTREPIRKFVEAGTRIGLPHRVYRESVFLTRPNNRNTTVLGMVLNPTTDGRVRIWAASEPLAEIFGLTKERIEEIFATNYSESTAEGLYDQLARFEKLVRDTQVQSRSGE
jgi:Holliday junction resolvase-like predicted endonuclease